MHQAQWQRVPLLRTTTQPSRTVAIEPLIHSQLIWRSFATIDCYWEEERTYITDHNALSCYHCVVTLAGFFTYRTDTSLYYVLLTLTEIGCSGFPFELLLILLRASDGSVISDQDRAVACVVENKLCSRARASLWMWLINFSI